MGSSQLRRSEPSAEVAQEPHPPRGRDYRSFGAECYPGRTNTHDPDAQCQSAHISIAAAYGYNAWAYRPGGAFLSVLLVPLLFLVLVHHFPAPAPTPAVAAAAAAAPPIPAPRPPSAPPAPTPSAVPVAGALGAVADEIAR